MYMVKRLQRGGEHRRREALGLCGSGPPALAVALRMQGSSGVRLGVTDFCNMCLPSVTKNGTIRSASRSGRVPRDTELRRCTPRVTGVVYYSQHLSAYSNSQQRANLKCIPLRSRVSKPINGLEVLSNPGARPATPAHLARAL